MQHITIRDGMYSAENTKHLKYFAKFPTYSLQNKHVLMDFHSEGFHNNTHL